MRKIVATRAPVGVALSLLLPMLLVGCGKSEAGAHEILNFDVSGSARDPKANLVNEAKNAVASKVEAMAAGDRITAVGFNFAPGTSCEPLVFTIASDANSEEERSQRAANLAGLVEAFDGYVTCLTSGDSGFAGKGSAVFGSIPTALDKANVSDYPVDRIVTITDGCSVGEGAPVCSPALLTRNDVALTVVDDLPPELKPDLKGIQLEFVGLGQGTSLQADQVARLTSIYAAYTNSVNATNK